MAISEHIPLQFVRSFDMVCPRTIHLHQFQQMPCICTIASANDNHGISFAAKSTAAFCRCAVAKQIVRSTRYSPGRCFFSSLSISSNFATQKSFDDYSITPLLWNSRDIFYTFDTDSVFSCPFLKYFLLLGDFFLRQQSEDSHLCRLSIFFLCQTHIRTGCVNNRQTLLLLPAV